MAALRPDQRDDRVRRLPAAAQRAAARAADHGDRDVSFILQNVGARLEGPELRHARRTSSRRARCSRSAASTYTWNKLIVVLITVPVLLALLYLVQRTRQGKAMRATAQDMDASAIMGINVNRTISFTFLIAGALAGAGGPALRALRDDGALRPGLPARADRVHRRPCSAASATSPAPSSARS